MTPKCFHPLKIRENPEVQLGGAAKLNPKNIQMKEVYTNVYYDTESQV